MFLHGWGLSGIVFEGQAMAFSDQYRVITLDYRGHGQSDKPKNGYTIAELSSDLRNFILNLNLEDVTLVGWSAGGSIVMDYLIRYGDRVTKAVFVGGAVPRYTSAPDFEFGLTDKEVRQNLEALKNDRLTTLRAMCDGCFHTDVGIPMKEWFFNVFMQHSWFVDKIIHDLAIIDFRDKLSDIRIPVAFFHGKHDVLVPFAMSKYSAGVVPGAKFVVFENSGHTPFLEENNRFNEELASFIAGF